MNIFSRFSRNKKNSTQGNSQENAQTTTITTTTPATNKNNNHSQSSSDNDQNNHQDASKNIFKIGIKKSSNAILGSILSIFSKNTVNDYMMEKVEESLILNDIDPDIVQKMLSEMKRKKLFKKHITQDINQNITQNIEQDITQGLKNESKNKSNNDSSNHSTQDSNTKSLIPQIISIAKEVARKNSKILKYYEKNSLNNSSHDHPSNNDSSDNSHYKSIHNSSQQSLDLNLKNEKNYSDLFLQKVMNFLGQYSSTDQSSKKNSDFTPEQSEKNNTTTHKPYTITFIGMNGSGKTTTIAKIAHKLKKMGLNGKIICGDTFRSAATEQLIEWSKKLDIEAMHKNNTDPAALIFESVQKNYQNNHQNNFQSKYQSKSQSQSNSACDYSPHNDSSQNDSLCDYLLIDTAGRLHTNTNLMNEMQKIERVLKKIDASYPNESILVIDASVGQSVYEHIEQFSKYTKLTGIVVTKMDNSAKGGIIIGIASRFEIPIYYMGVGEQLSDLVQFDYDDFLDELLNIPQ